MADGPLAGLRIVERVDGLAGGFAGFLLAGLGAEVVRVEAPGAAHAPGERILHRGKRSVALDLATRDDGPCWVALVGGADAVVTGERGPGVDAAEGLVRCGVTTWGADGHPEGLSPDEALVAATTGVHALQWSWAQRPVWLVTPVVSYMGGALAALGVAAALFARRRGAPGQEVAVDGLGAALALNSGTYVRSVGLGGSLLQGGDPRGVFPNYSTYPTADGWVFVGALTQAFWVKLAVALGRADLLADPRLEGHPFTFGQPEIRSFVRGELDPLFRSRPTAAWLETLRAADIPCGPVRTRTEALADADARALGLIAALDDPVLGSTWQPAEPALFSDTPAPRPRPAVLPGADTAAVRAEAPGWRRAPALATAPSPATCLDGIRVLDLTSYIAGPVCPMLLAELGADVVKVESSDGDPFRVAAFAFIGWNRGKRGLVLDLKRPEGAAVFLDLVRGADVVVDNFRAGVMERLGIGWERLRAANPRLVHTSITGWGTSGPLAALPGFDPIFQAQSGLMAAQGGRADPVFHVIAYNDYMAGALGALATVAALVARERTGRGQRVDVSLFRTSTWRRRQSWRRAHRERAADHSGPSARRRPYACRDGWPCVAAGDAAQAAALGRLAGVAVAPGEPAEGAAADAIARVLGDEPRAAALARLAAAGVPAAPCLDFAELFADPFLAARGCFAVEPHPSATSSSLAPSCSAMLKAGGSAPLLGADSAGCSARRARRGADRALVARGGAGGGGEQDETLRSTSAYGAPARYGSRQAAQPRRGHGKRRMSRLSSGPAASASILVCPRARHRRLGIGLRV
jgi:crotonobetainyl-CoA:carnitine CoA-transferase CaiB-like acyl-CoA transferase